MMHFATKSNSTSVTNGKGRLTGRTDPSGSYTFYYDARGNLTKEEKTINGFPNVLYTTENAYNKDNVLTSITYPSGRVVGYTLDVTDRITQVDTTLSGNSKTLASSITYLPYGGITGLTYGNILSLTHGYDNQYRTSSIAVGSILDRTYVYDANGNITSVDDNEPQGNEALESAGIYSYDQGTNLLADIQAGSPVVYDYDENGNIVSANNRTFTYDLSNRLITVQEGSTTLGQYVYNAINQRIKKTVQGQTTIFHYDLQGHLIAETSASGQTLVEYFYLGDQPLAMIKPGETESVYYFHNDHLGTPQILTDDNATVSWIATYTPFGQAVASVETVENPFRLPGQYYDQDTGLHYNWNRYYDPKTGRYLTPDPIGLKSGINLFTYVENNPILRLDLKGLDITNKCNKDLWVHIKGWEKVAPNETKKGDTDAVCEGRPDSSGNCKAFKWIDCFDADASCGEDGSMNEPQLTYVGTKHTAKKDDLLRDCICGNKTLADMAQGIWGGWKNAKSFGSSPPGCK
jgi:RHS repeat-associated protein